MQSNSSYETKLARVCESDPRPFSSYVQIPIECNSHKQLARTGTLNVKLAADSEMEPVLYVVFSDEASRLSSICSFNMTTIEQHFLETIRDCSQLKFRADLLNKFEGSSENCIGEIPVRNKNIACYTDGINRFINGKDPFIGDHLLTVSNGLYKKKIFSIESSVVFSKL